MRNLRSEWYSDLLKSLKWPFSSNHLPPPQQWEGISALMSTCQGSMTGSCSRKAWGKGLAPGPSGRPLRGSPGTSCNGRPCLADGLKGGEVLLTKALIFLSLLCAFY